MAAIYKKEMRSFFGSVMGWLFVALMLLVFGIYTSVMNLSKSYSDFALVPFNAQYIYLIVIPLLTMRALAEERRQRTDQLLYSTSLGVYDIVLGKYLAMVTIIAIPLAISCIYPLVLSNFGRMELRTAYSAMAAFFFLGISLAAIGLFFSSISSNQFVSAAICFGVLLLCYFGGDLKSLLSSKIETSLYFFTVLIVALALLTRYMTKNWMAAGMIFAVLEIILLIVYLLSPSVLDGSVAAVIGSIAVFSRLEPFCDGIFDISALIYFISLSWLFVFFSVQAFEKRRWS
jgi:ABC-2 type transport system permease protein